MDGTNSDDVKKADAASDYLSDYSNNEFSTYKNDTTDESKPYIRCKLDGLKKTYVIEFEFKLPANTDNDISKEVASPGKTVKGTFERYRKNKYRSTYILTVSGDKGTILFCKETQSSLSGEEDKVDADDFDKVFVDVDKDRWSYAYVMYCYKHNITKGTGADTFSPDIQIDASQFITLMMRLLGYTEVNPDTALEKSVEYKLFPQEKINELTNKKVFTRSDMVQIVYNSLKTQMDDETVFADYLLEKGVLTEQKIEQIK